MPVEVLVMCPSCARPQPPAPSCVHCGAPLPTAPERPAAQTPPPTQPGEAKAPSPRMELELGANRQLVLGEDAVELRSAGAGTERIPLAQLRRVRLVGTRPIGKMLGAMAPLFVGLVLVETFLFRVVFLVLLALTLWYFLRARTWVLCLESEGEPERRLPLFRGPRGSGAGVDAQGRWLQVAEGLRQRGVQVETAADGTPRSRT